MKRHQETVINADSIKRLCQYEDVSVRHIHEYFKDDLTYILENVNAHALLTELHSRNVLNAEIYLSIKNELGDVSFANRLLEDILRLGRNAVIGFWECLYTLPKEHLHPHLLAILDELNQKGESLVEQILLDKHGHALSPELKDIQEQHKQHLLTKTQTLVEPRPPGTTLGLQKFNINERYVNLVVFSTDQFRQRSQNELIETGAKHEECLKETRMEYISPNKLFRWSQKSQCIPHAVIVSGVPGIGKTTMMQKFVYDWVTGELYQRFAFVFFLKFRELNKKCEVSLEEMILEQCPYLENQLGSILEHPERLLFIFDGLDESIHQMDFRSSKLCTNTKDRKHFGVIAVSLVKQKLLQGCSVLITSRPTRLVSVDISAFQRITEIMGFLHSDRKIYFEHFFDKEEFSEKAFHYVQENPMLYTFCYIPSYCWIVCTVLSMCFKAQPTNNDKLMASLPKTMTQLFVIFVSNILTNHSPKRDDVRSTRDLLTSVGWMAEHGVMNHIIVFDERHLRSFNVSNDSHLFSSFMLESGQPPAVDYTFLHLTFQEFFAALVHFISYDSDKLLDSLNKAKSYEDGRAEIFLRFLCGLSDNSTRSMLKSHVKYLSMQASRDVINWIQQKIAEEQRDMKELLNSFYCLYESRNNALVLKCIGSKNDTAFSFVRLNPLDCSVLSFILESRRETEELNLGSCNIQDEGLKKLVPALHTIQNLSLYRNNLTSSSCTHLASGIQNNQTMRKLDLSVNSLEGPDFCHLMTSVQTSQIEELLLRSNNLTDQSYVYLACGIRNNKTLRKLHLSGNNLEGPHLRDLMEALQTSRIEELHLQYSKLTDSSCIHLASGISNNQTLRKFDLSQNNLAGPHFTDLVTAVETSRIEELLMYEIGLTDEHAPLLVSLSNNRNLTHLDLGRNGISDNASGYIRDLIVNTSSLREIRLFSHHMSHTVRRELKNLENLRPELKVYIE
ncbi:NACHT, LRR and PYD domains-containing protein 3-like [Aquarana catesbeiana]|uniref:NACHT, LRR and PYD domains-containing protein 3-like n=1 Tax=Aquarana catesbeiana TaxID=8400 RepID=UPI003CC98FC9